MAKIVQRRVKVTTDGIDVAKILVWCKKTVDGVPDYPDPVQKEIAYVPGQLEYYLNLPADIFVAEGEYYLAVAPQDAAGNIGDITVKQYFFDFTAPNALLLEIL